MSSTDRAHAIMSSLGLRYARLDAFMTNDDYVAWGKSANQAEFCRAENADLVQLLEEEETLESLLEVPFGLKHVRDLRAVMKLSAAVAGERRDDLVRHSLFHPVFASFSLGFSTALACAQRAKHGCARDTIRRLSRRQHDACLEWGVAVTTFYLALVERNGLFGKASDLELYGIEDRWRLLSDERRWLCFDRVRACAAAGRAAGEVWCADESAEVPPYFLNALADFIAAYADRQFE